MKSQYIFNNEAIASVAFGYFISINKQVSFAKAVLFFPFVLHDLTVKRLNSSSYKRSIEEFIVQYPSCLVNFNTRFLDFLPLAINSITILNEAKVITIHQDEILYNDESNFLPKSAGKRIEKIIKATEALSILLMQEKTSSLYLKLKIRL